MIRFRHLTLSDCAHLLSNLRDHDRREFERLGGISPESLYANRGDSMAVETVGGELICAYGCTPHEVIPGAGIVWLMGTPLLDRFMFALCKRAREVVDGWLEQYQSLTNLCDVENLRIRTWLRWLGFRFTTTVPINGHPFQVFIKERPCATPSRSRP